MMALAPDKSVAIKCDLCIRRLAKDLEPACVASCPTKALFLSDDEPEAVGAAQGAKAEGKTS
jgi:Fe-S-cluster-containing dehydrogenase component